MVFKIRNNKTKLYLDKYGHESKKGRAFVSIGDVRRCLSNRKRVFNVNNWEIVVYIENSCFPLSDV